MINFITSDDSFKIFYYNNIILDIDSCLYGHIWKCAEILGIDKQHIKSVKPDNELIQDLFIRMNYSNLPYFNLLNDSSSKNTVSEETLNILKTNFSNYFDNVKMELDKMFGVSNDFNFIFNVVSASHDFIAAFGKRIKPDTAYITYYEGHDLTSNNILNDYLIVLFHEYCHLYLYNHQDFQKFIKSLYMDSFSNIIRVEKFRMPLEELLVTGIFNRKTKSYLNKIIYSEKDFDQENNFSGILFNFFDSQKSGNDKYDVKKWKPLIEKILVK